MRSNGVLDSSGSSRGDEKWSGSGSIVQLKPTGYPDGCNTGCKTERIVKNDSNVLNLSNYKTGAAIDQDTKGGGRESRARLGGGQQEP